MHRFFRRLLHPFRRREFEDRLSIEFDHHLEQRAVANQAAGMDPDAARAAARRQFGHVDGLKETARDQRGWVWLEQFGQDLRYGLRGLTKSPGYAAAAMLTLALGIGTSTAIFSVIYGVLLAPYPYAKSNEIWAPDVRDAKSGHGVGLVLWDYVEMARLPGVASAMATRWGHSMVLSGGINPEIITAPMLTGTAFQFLGVPAILGRGLVPSDIRPDGQPEPVTVLSFRLWQRLYNGDPNVVGRKIVLDDQDYTVVGVMPPRFGWYTDDGLWVPLSTLDLTQPVRPIVRFKPGVTREVAGAQLLALMKQQAHVAPERFPKDGFTAGFDNYLDVTVASGAMRTSLFVLLGAVGFLLLIACTNVANLQLARGAGRSRELAVRLALGAGRGRLIRQLLTESVVLALAGGAAGVGFAYGLVQIIVALLPPRYVPNEARITMNGWVLAFSTGLSVLAGVAAGLAPAWQCTRPDVNEALKDGGAAAGSRRSNRTRNTLAVAQVALSVVLLVGAGITTLSFVQMQYVDRGFPTEHMLVLRVPLPPKRYPTFAQRLGFSRDFLERLCALPGVAHATLGIPPSLETRSSVDITGQPKPPNGMALNFIDVDYLATYDLKLVDGRDLTPAEIANGDHVALVSEAAAKLWGNGVSPLGRTVSVDALVSGAAAEQPHNPTKVVTVVGILRDVEPFGPSRPAPAVIFVPYTLRAPTGRVFVLRTAIEPNALLNTVRTELRALDKEQPMQQPVTFEELVDNMTQGPRFNTALFALVAGVALALAAAGIYSVLSYAVAQRAREIGLRMALGAGAADVRRLFLGVGARLVGVGLALGVAASLALAQVIRHQLFGAPGLAPTAFVGAVLLLAATAFLACLIPAHRATKVDPLVALRAE